jgi:hypothetical protein
VSSPWKLATSFWLLILRVEGTRDIVEQKVVSVGESGYTVKEVTTSSGGVCRGTYVDSRYMEFLQEKLVLVKRSAF